MTPQVRLREVSIQIDVQDGLVAVWAVGTKGDVLYRHGVTEDCPQVHELAVIPSVYKQVHVSILITILSSQRSSPRFLKWGGARQHNLWLKKFPIINVLSAQMGQKTPQVSRFCREAHGLQDSLTSS